MTMNQPVSDLPGSRRPLSVTNADYPFDFTRIGRPEYLRDQCQPSNAIVPKTQNSRSGQIATIELVCFLTESRIVVTMLV